MLSFNKVIRAAKGTAGRVAFIAKDKSPELCFIGGVISLGAAAYFIWNGKEKFQKVRHEFKTCMENVAEKEQMVRDGEIDPAEYTPKDAKIERRRYTFKAIRAYVRVFFPILLLAFGGVGLMHKSVDIWKGRYVASAAVVAKQNEYIRELEDQVGEEKLEELHPKSPTEEAESEEDHKLRPPHSYWFDERSKNFVKGNPEANRFFLAHAEEYFNDILCMRTQDGKKPGGILGNEMLEYLDIKCGSDEIVGTQEGAVMGNTKSKDKKDHAAGYVDFGVFHTNKKVDFGQPILLTFNWDATPILGRIGMPKR